VLNQLLHDRFTAQEHGIDPLTTLESPYLSGERPVGTRVDDLIRTTQRGILVTNFWYIRPVNPSDLTLTGMTRDGTFLIENGEITSAVPELPVSREPPARLQPGGNLHRPGRSGHVGNREVPGACHADQRL
jgi:predicted Zn-dependent protease